MRRDVNWDWEYLPGKSVTKYRKVLGTYILVPLVLTAPKSYFFQLKQISLFQFSCIV